MEKGKEPPRVLRRFLRSYCSPEIFPEIEGDLYEMYQRWHEKRGTLLANVTYFLNAISFFRPFIIKKHTEGPRFSHIRMLGNYFKITKRTFERNMVQSMISLSCLAIGMASFMMLISYVSKERSYDRFWEGQDDIYRISEVSSGAKSDLNGSATTWSALGSSVRERIPQVQALTMFGKADSYFPKYIYLDVKGINETFLDSRELIFTDSSFFDVFHLKFLKGDTKGYELPSSLILTASIADVLFGKEWRGAGPGDKHYPIGKDVLLKQAFTVYDRLTLVGIVEDLPVNSHLIGKAFSHGRIYNFPNISDWGAYGNIMHTYVRLHPGSDMSDFQEVIDRIGKESEVLGEPLRFPVQKMTDIHLTSDLHNELKSNGNGLFTDILLMVAIIVLCVATMNYVNLTIVQTIERAKEIGLRKLIGATRSGLIVQFLFSSFIINGIGALLAFTIIWEMVPVLNAYLDISLGMVLYWEGIPYAPLFIFTFLVVYVVVSLVSGVYPAWLLSSFDPLCTIRNGNFSKIDSGGGRTRKMMVLFQLTATLFLLMVTVNVYRQVSYMRERDIGFSKERIIVLDNTFSRDTSINERYDGLRADIVRHTIFNDVTISSTYPGGDLHTWMYRRKKDSEHKEVAIMMIDDDFFATYGIDMINGRTFVRESESDLQRVILNESAVAHLGFKNGKEAMGSIIVDNFHEMNGREIIGIVKDHHQYSLKSQKLPIVYHCSGATFKKDKNGDISHSTFRRDNGYISVRIGGDGSPKDAIPLLERIWEDNFERKELHYFFLDERFDHQYRADIRFGKVFGLFSFLSLSISVLGLFGFVSYSIRQRKKEISIRKVFGATWGELCYILSRTYIQVILISSSIAVPLSYLLVERWSWEFAYKVGMDSGTFLFPIAIVVLVIAITIGTRILRASSLIPIKPLREE